MGTDQLTSVAALRSWNDQLLGSGVPIGLDGRSWDATTPWGNVLAQPHQGGRHYGARQRRVMGGIQGNLLDPSTDASDTAPMDPPGTLLQMKRVDEVYDHMRDGWVARDAVVQEKPAEKDTYAAYAFTFTRRFDQQMMNSTSTVDIRSEWLRQVGADVVGAVSGISWTAKPLKINPQVLIAFLPAFEEHASKLRSLEIRATNDSTALDHLEFFIAVLRSEYEATLSELSSLLLHGEINFELIYTLLVPGSILYFPCPVSGAPRSARLVSIDLQALPRLRYWELEIEYVEYDSGGLAAGSQSKVANGAQFGFAKLPLTIFEFKGAKKVTNLPVFPFQYFAGSEDLKARLVERGRKWVELQGMHHKYHSGIAFHNENGCYVKVNCNSRIMVDWETFSQTVPNYQLPSVTKTLNGEEISRHAAAYNIGSITSFETPRNNTPQEWNDELLLLCSTIVYGFSLSDKLWLEFNVENIDSFEWNDESFENLVLAHNEKKLVKSLVEAHSISGAAFDDFVKGKGQGLVINLFGNPGVGKTLTAEATSEHVRKPLYVVGAGDLGTEASVLDANLTRIFNISATWDAVVLIDEADVFLEERSLHDLERNAMVAVFLRQLEYFRGILFLTTNRVRTFDEAFQSRIHVSLRYRDLTDEARQHIWVAFLKKAHASEATGASSPRDASLDTILTDTEMCSLSTRNVNGRQIKNVVRTASALARSAKESMNYVHLVQVLDLMEAFELDRASA